MLFKLEGRFDEARVLIEEAWSSYPDRFGLLRQLANFDSINPVPIENIWPALDKAALESPDDDRIWLGRANLAIRTGDFAKARKWLDDCLRRRPNDGSVRKSKLDLAVATGGTVEAQQALKELPADKIRADQVLTLAPGSPRNWATRSASGKRSRSCLRASPASFKLSSAWQSWNY